MAADGDLERLTQIIKFSRDFTSYIDRTSEFQTSELNIRSHDRNAWRQVHRLIQPVSNFAYNVRQFFTIGRNASEEYEGTNHVTYETLLQIRPALQTHLETATSSYNMFDVAYNEAANDTVYETGRRECEQLQVQVRSMKIRTRNLIFATFFFLLIIVACAVHQYAYNGDGIYDRISTIVGAYGFPLRESSLVMASLIGLGLYKVFRSYYVCKNMEIICERLSSSFRSAERLVNSFNENVGNINRPMSAMLVSLRNISQAVDQRQTPHTQPPAEPPQTTGLTQVINSLFSWITSYFERSQPQRNEEPPAIQVNMENPTIRLEVDAFFQKFQEAAEHLPSIQLNVEETEATYRARLNLE